MSIRSARLLLALLCFIAAEARADFSNSSMGLTLGYASLRLNGAESWSVPLGLNASLYLDDGFELTASFNVLYFRAAATPPDALALAPAVGFRYLFLQETIRPFVGAELGYLHVFSPLALHDFVGIGPKAGVDFFLSDGFSLGVQVEAGFYFTVGQEHLTSRLQAAATAKVYF